MGKDPSNENDDFNQLFITVFFGNNQEVLFNPHCKGLYLKECMQEKADCASNIMLDLINTKGELTNVFSKENLGLYASSFLKGRKKYVLIQKIHLDEEGPDGEKLIKYEALLKNASRRFPKISERLDRLSTRCLTPASVADSKSKKSPVGGKAQSFKRYSKVKTSSSKSVKRRIS